MDSVITVTDLKKTYADGTQALKGISFQVQRGEFFGFLGPNGAGKSTTIKILITLLDKSEGSASVLGYDTVRDPTEIRRRIGYAAQETGIDGDLTGRENLTLQGRLYHLPVDMLKKRVAELLDLMDLTDDADQPAGAYSGSMRKRLDLATGLIHRPEALFLDEPTAGLDPQARSSLWKYLERLNQEEGLTIFLTTHYMEEADRLCHRVAIIDLGQIIAEGTPASLKAGVGGDVISLTLSSDGVPPALSQDCATAVLRHLDFVNGVTAVDKGLSVVVSDGGSAVPQILHALDGAGVTVAQLSLTSPTLDDVFLKYTGYSIRHDERDTNWHSSRRDGPFGRRRRRS